MCYTIEEIREKSVPIAKKHGIERMGLFGSYARGEATDASDVDFYIDKGRINDLVDYFSFVLDLEQALGCHVDVITSGISDREFYKKITENGVLLYEELGTGHAQSSRS